MPKLNKNQSTDAKKSDTRREVKYGVIRFAEETERKRFLAC